MCSVLRFSGLCPLIPINRTDDWRSVARLPQQLPSPSRNSVHRQLLCVCMNEWVRVSVSGWRGGGELVAYLQYAQTCFYSESNPKATMSEN